MEARISGVYPEEENLGKGCAFWKVVPGVKGCCYPRPEMSQKPRTSCDGEIDEACLFLKDRRPPTTLTLEQAEELKIRVPDFDYESYIPHNNTT
jgi:hypothetical protein